MDFLKGFHGEFGWLIWGIVGLGVIWFFRGGTESPTAHGGAYIKPLAPVDSGRVYGTYYAGGDAGQNETLDLPRAPGNFLRKTGLFLGDAFTQVREVKDGRITSLLGKKIYFGDTAQAKAKNPDEEHIVVEADPYSKNVIGISGLVLRGAGLDTSILLPKAAELALTGTPPDKTDILLPPGGRAIIVSGRSPIGTSFRVNKCSGYLSQFQKYVPDLDRSCPYPTDELKLYGPAGEATCAEFVERIPRCKIFQGAPSKALSNACVNFLAEKLNYNACVANHKKDADFYSKEWRLFLNQQNELWRNENEIIRLMDAENTVLDAVTY
ncbi:MAG: hypothetical protein AAB775_00900 [Patescibacteria group bacterium]